MSEDKQLAKMFSAPPIELVRAAMSLMEQAQIHPARISTEAVSVLITEARKAERAKIVEWLRERAHCIWLLAPDDSPELAKHEAIEDCAACIESGVHHE